MKALNRRGFVPQQLTKAVRLTIGVLLSAAAALAASMMFSTKSWRIFVPLAFVVVLVLLAARYGVAVSVFGSVVTAIIFAHFLFSPLGSFRIESAGAKTNLAWMVLAAVGISYLLFPPQIGKHPKE